MNDDPKAELARRYNQATALQPAELFSDFVHIEEDDTGFFLRIIFYASRPEVGDKLGDPIVPVARIAISRTELEYKLSQVEQPRGDYWDNIPFWADRRAKHRQP